MNTLTWGYMAAAVALAALGNYISSIWAADANKMSWTFAALLVVSPLVFITFGLVSRRLGLAIAAGTVDALITVSTVLIGLIFLKEWQRVSLVQYIGLGFAVVGIVLMVFASNGDADAPH